jgi:prefoldin subunit 5
MDNNDITVRAEIAEMKTQLTDALGRLARSEGALEQLNKAIATGNRMTNWQFIGFVVVMAGTLFGTLYWATGLLERRLDQFDRNINTRFEQVDKRFEQVDKRFEQVDKRFEQIDKRFEQMDKRFEQMDKRFEDLKQVVLSRR